MRHKHLLGWALVMVSGFGIGFAFAYKPGNSPFLISSVNQKRSNLEPVTAKAPLPISFRWGTLESTDYFKYVINLRSIGCPEQTVCDLIKSELDKMFAEKWKQTHKPVVETRYWVSVPYSYYLKRREDREIAKFDSQKSALMKQLLGTSAGECECAEEHFPVAHGFTSSEEKQKKVDQILSGFESDERELDMMATLFTNKTAVARWRLALIAEKREALLAVLEPAELTRLEMTVSPRAQHLREYLYGFQPTESEFQAIYAFRQGGQTLNLENQANDIPITASASGRKELEDGLRDQIGEERYNAFRMMVNQDYQALSMVGRLLSWDSAKLAPALAIIEDYAKTEQKELRNPLVDLQKLKLDRDRQLRAILGPGRYEEFQRRRIYSGTPGPTFQYW